MQEQVQSATSILADLHARVIALEGKYNLMGERLLMVNQNMIEEYKKMMREVRLINNDGREMKRENETIKESMKTVVKELDSFAKKANVRILEKYVNLLSPMKFVTDEQLKRALEEKRE